MAHDDEDEMVTEETRPSRRKGRDDNDAEDEDRPRPKGDKPMPVRLVAAIIASMAWGFLALHDSCTSTGGSILNVVHIHEFRKMQEKGREDLRRMGVNQIDFGNVPQLEFGLPYTLMVLQLGQSLLAALLIAGGSLLLVRMRIGKFVVMGVPALMALVEILGIVICLILTKGLILTPHNFSFLIFLFFSVVVAGCNIFMLLNKDVSKALK
jgi:hypothetical protein